MSRREQYEVFGCGCGCVKRTRVHLLLRDGVTYKGTDVDAPDTVQNRYVVAATGVPLWRDPNGGIGPAIGRRGVDVFRQAEVPRQAGLQVEQIAIGQERAKDLIGPCRAAFSTMVLLLPLSWMVSLPAPPTIQFPRPLTVILSLPAPPQMTLPVPAAVIASLPVVLIFNARPVLRTAPMPRPSARRFRATGPPTFRARGCRAQSGRPAWHPRRR